MFSSFYCGAGFSRAYRLRQQPRFTVDISAVKRVAKLVCVLDRALMCPAVIAPSGLMPEPLVIIAPGASKVMNVGP